MSQTAPWGRLHAVALTDTRNPVSSPATRKADAVWDSQTQTLPVGTRVRNPRRGLEGVTRSEPFCNSPLGSDRRARVWVNYTDSVPVVAVDYLRELHIVDDNRQSAGHTRIAAMTCQCDPADPCLSCDASGRAATPVPAAASAQLRHPSDRQPTLAATTSAPTTDPH